MTAGSRQQAAGSNVGAIHESPSQLASTMTNLKCTYCGAEYDADTLQTLCPKDGRVLAPQYDLARAARTMTKEALRDRTTSMWRYIEIMPARDPANVVTLGEGWT